MPSIHWLDLSIINSRLCACVCLPAGGLMSGGGIRGTMIGRPPCSLATVVEEEEEELGCAGVSVATLLRDVGVKAELLA